ncbi:hypothetical protein B0A55_05715 [Friedmanniomyces simplex]|uniref:Uncharacterized protein n=1 Tax=Friedmanniomyces simplex TaxID=329884 RepID=A0A4U0XEA0_9PEZI|nr:hypothetical protein B0A55_05715 [Friedmanniomyces simplex]
MSVLIAAWLALFCFLSHVAATAAPCPECEEGMEMPPPVIITATEPCCECGECEDMPMTTPAVFVSTVSVCAATTVQSSIIPYTFGSSTFWISSCVPSTLWYTPSATTLWYTQNATAPTCAPATSVTITLPATTSIASTTIYANGSAPPAQTIVSTAVSMVYQSGTPPPAQTATYTTVSTVYSYESGTPPLAQTVTVISTQGYTSELDFTSQIYTTLPGVTVTGSTTIVSTTTSLTTTTSTIVQTETATQTSLSVSSAPGQTSTFDVTFTTQLPAQTSYATMTIGTQTIVSTLSVATVQSNEHFGAVDANGDQHSACLDRHAHRDQHARCVDRHANRHNHPSPSNQDNHNHNAGTLYIDQHRYGNGDGNNSFGGCDYAYNYCHQRQILHRHRYRDEDLECHPYWTTVWTIWVNLVTSVCHTTSSTVSLVSACASPTGSFKIGVQNFGGACMSSEYGGAVPNRDHNTLVLSTLASNCTTFSAVSNGQTTELTSAGLTLYSDQNSQYAGDSPLYFDSINSIQNSQYGTYSEAVQFCLQPDNSFIVQNPSIGANVLQLCNNVLWLYTPGNATSSGCTTVKLIEGVGAAPASY